MDRVIQLCTVDGCIKIDATNEKWCQCFLVRDDSIIALGAHSLDYIAKHLLNALHGEPSLGIRLLPDDAYDDNLRWVLSLFEEHSSAYASWDHGNMMLHWQDKDAEWISIMRLSPERIAEWKRLLVDGTQLSLPSQQYVVP